MNLEAMRVAFTHNGLIDEKLKIIIEASILECQKVIGDSTVTLCSVPDATFKYTQCVFKENYTKCPNVTAKRDCKKYLNLLQNCMPIPIS